MSNQGYLKVMSDAFDDELAKIASCSSHTRKDRRPIRVAKLIKKAARYVKVTGEGAKKLRLAPGIAGGALLGIGGYEKSKSEGRKYLLGRQVHKQMKQRARG